LRNPSLAREFGLGGVISFGSHIGGSRVRSRSCATSVAIDLLTWPAWVSAIRKADRSPTVTAPFTEWPAMATLGRIGMRSWPNA